MQLVPDLCRAVRLSYSENGQKSTIYSLLQNIGNWITLQFLNQGPRTFPQFLNWEGIILPQFQNIETRIMLGFQIHGGRTLHQFLSRGCIILVQIHDDKTLCLFLEVDVSLRSSSWTKTAERRANSWGKRLELRQPTTMWSLSRGTSTKFGYE